MGRSEQSDFASVAVSHGKWVLFCTVENEKPQVAAGVLGEDVALWAEAANVVLEGSWCSPQGVCLIFL